MKGRSDSSIATVLLAGHLIRRGAAPLSTSRFWSLLATVGDPARLLGMDASGVGALTGLDGGEAERVVSLLEGGVALALELEKLDSSGVQVITRFDNRYPERLIDRLGKTAPPVLHIAGPVELLEQDGIGVVGSRNVGREAMEVAEEIARLAVKEGLPVVSGAARGIDQTAMAAALEAGGRVLGIPAEAMVKLLKDPSVRRSILDENLCMATPFAPSAGFSVGNAMSRNKLIYAFSRVTVVVTSDDGSGGTWAGATEALDKRIGSIAVWTGAGAGPGNSKLARLGAVQFDSVAELLNLGESGPAKTGGDDQLRLQF
ncbi:MAG: DNA-processing protein DprA [Actinomycetota bacterium]